MISVFKKRHIPKDGDLCVCKHPYIAHATDYKACTRRCDCTYFVRLSRRNAKNKPWKVG